MSRTSSTTGTIATQRGLLLVETLTAILIFSSGVLGAVMLQAHAIRHIGDAQYRAEANHLALSLIAQMWANDPASLAERYESSRGGAGFRDFAKAAQLLPGAALAANAPEVSITAGPSSASKTVTVTLHWQLPGDAQTHRHVVSSVIGRN